MANSGLFGPFSLTSNGVEENVTGIGPGAYALGNTQTDGFHIQYVGRSDEDLAARLQQHVPERYPQFKHAFYKSAKAAFEKECHLYNDFSPPDNKVHPARPRGEDWSCPVCSVFD